MNKNTKLIVIGGALGIILILGIFWLAGGKTFGGISPALSRFNTIATSSTMTVAGDIRIIATTTDRSLLVVCNDSANKVYLSIHNDTPITWDGTRVHYGNIAVAANTCYTFNNDNLYTGSVRASSTISSELLITEVHW